MEVVEANFNGSCRREQLLLDVVHERRRGGIGTVPSGRVGPAYLSNSIVNNYGQIWRSSTFMIANRLYSSHGTINKTHVDPKVS